MRLKHVKGADEAILSSPYVLQEPERYRGRWKEYFGAEHPLHIEIGMGKGRFITELAARNPDISYIGIEKYSSVLIKAVKKQEELGLSNLVFLCVDAAGVTELFAPGEVDRLYLNFSDPWPKDRHAKRRLTSPQFLKLWQEILSCGGRLEFKTDNMPLFDWSLTTLPAAGWRLAGVTHDLHADPVLSAGNIMTEYEEKFSSRGNPIGKLIALPPEESCPLQAPADAR